MVTGILFPDVNHFHPLLDGHALARAGAPCVGVKIGQRTKDSTADASVAKAEAAGLIVIGYIFGTNRRGATQAHDLARWFPWKPGRIWCIDNESNGPDPSDSISQAQAAECVKTLHDLHPQGQWPIEYRSRYTTKHGSGLQWIAQYGPTSAPSGSDLWQFYGGVVGESPHIMPGVAGPVCDMNKLVCSLDKLKVAAGLTSGGGFLAKLTDAEQQDLYEKVKNIWNWHVGASATHKDKAGRYSAGGADQDAANQKILKSTKL